MKSADAEFSGRLHLHRVIIKFDNSPAMIYTAVSILSQGGQK